MGYPSGFCCSGGIRTQNRIQTGRLYTHYGVFLWSIDERRHPDHGFRLRLRDPLPDSTCISGSVAILADSGRMECTVQRNTGAFQREPSAVRNPGRRSPVSHRISPAGIRWDLRSSSDPLRISANPVQTLSIRKTAADGIQFHPGVSNDRCETRSFRPGVHPGFRDFLFNCYSETPHDGKAK